MGRVPSAIFRRHYLTALSDGISPDGNLGTATWGQVERIPDNFSIGPFSLCDFHGYSAS
jgi:hypothetical protein